MKKYSYLLALILLTAAGQQLNAQCPGTPSTPFDAARGGVTTTSGTLINSQPGSTWTQDGGLDDADGGTWTVSGDVYINGDFRLSNNSSLVIETGGRLFVYGNVYVNSGSTLTLNTGGNLYFYGDEWVNQPGAVINNVGGAGSVSYIMPRPAPNATDAVSGSARYPINATAYTAIANTVQYVDGGDVNMNINIDQYNANNLSLCNLDNSAAAGSGDTRLNGVLTYRVAGGDVLLNDNNFIIPAAGSYAHNGISNYQGYFVTNGTGVVTKEAVANSAAYTFPVGQDEGDYTPVTLTNTSGSSNDYHVQVKDYTNSGSTEGVTTEGIDRTWQVYATTAGTANICLEHNSTTNPAGAGTDGSLFTNSTAFVTQQLLAGNWSTGTQTDGGSPVSNHCAAYTVPATVGDATGFFSKASDLLSPLPVILASFRGEVVNCSGELNWTTASESNSWKYVVEYSTNATHFSPVGSVTSKNNSNGASYSYRYNAIQPGNNYFRLDMVDKDNRHAYSDVVSLRSGCSANIMITPNPVQDVLNISGLQAGNQVMIVNPAGQQQTKAIATGTLLQIDTRHWAKGLYMVMVIENNQTVKTTKLLKQ